MENKELTKINHNSKGHPRYVIHFLRLLTEEEKETFNLTLYNKALAKAKTIGGKKYHNKQYGGGIAFTSWNIDSLKKDIERLSQTKLEEL